MSSEPKITVGMKFSDYSSIVSKLNYKNYTKEENREYGETTYFNNNRRVAYTRNFISTDRRSQTTTHDLMVQNDDGYTYSKLSYPTKKPTSVFFNEKFNVIETSTQRAVDYNGNGIVDEGEISNK